MAYLVMLFGLRLDWVVLLVYVRLLLVLWGFGCAYPNAPVASWTYRTSFLASRGSLLSSVYGQVGGVRQETYGDVLVELFEDVLVELFSETSHVCNQLSV